MGTPLYFFSVVSTKDKSGPDHTQIGVSATVNMYREGATTTASLTGGAQPSYYPVYPIRGRQETPLGAVR